MTGGADADVFVFSAVSETATRAPDVITDFQVGLDKIDLSAIDAINGGTDNSFLFIGSAAFVRGGAGQLQVTKSATRPSSWVT